MKYTETFTNCKICKKKIRYREPLKIKDEDKDDRRICLECAFYRVESIKIIVFIILGIGFLCIIFNLLDSTTPLKKISVFRMYSLILSGVAVLLGVVYYLVFIFLKLFRKRISFEYKKN